MSPYPGSWKLTNKHRHIHPLHTWRTHIPWVSTSCLFGEALIERPVHGGFIQAKISIWCVVSSVCINLGLCKRSKVWYIRVSHSCTDMQHSKEYTCKSNRKVTNSSQLKDYTEGKCHEGDHFNCNLHSCSAAGANAGSHGSGTLSK